MTEEQVFLAALDLPDRAVRTAYLDEACGQDSELRRQVEELLAAHERSGQFLDQPAAEQLAAGLQIPAGQTVALEMENGDAVADKRKTEPSLRDDDDDKLQFLSPSTRPESLGRLGHYEMLQVLGRGGFGIVFRAFDDMLQRVVAVKVMTQQIATLSPARKRFVREARSSAAIRHDNVVHVYEVGELPLPFLVMEFIPGETLQQKLDRNGPLEVSEILRIGRQIAEGLAAAHACELIHRDIKPGNILLEGGSHKVKITDFGLARASDDASISQSGIIAGTPMFMSPEQALGQKIDQRADLFSLGSVLYQMASGRPPFRAPSTLAVLKRVTEEPARPIQEIIPETPDWLCGIITKLHAKNPADRFQSAREVADLLADCEAKLKAKQAVQNVLPAAKPTGWKWAVAAAVLLLPVVALGVTEFGGMTHFFQGQATTTPPKFGGEPATDPDKKGGEPTPILVAEKQTPAATVSKPDYALEFDGKTAYVVVPSIRMDSHQPLTIELRVKFMDSSSLGPIACSYSPDSAMSLTRAWGNVPEFFVRREGKFKFAGTSGKFQSNLWMHLAGVWDCQDSVLYIDGKKHPIVSLVRTVNEKYTTSLNQPLALCTSFPTGRAPGQFLQCTLDEIRLSKIARYDREFPAPTLGDRFESDEHTLALYHCDEGAGSVLKDSSGNGHHGQIIGVKWVKGDGTAILP